MTAVVSSASKFVREEDDGNRIVWYNPNGKRDRCSTYSYRNKQNSTSWEKMEEEAIEKYYRKDSDEHYDVELYSDEELMMA